MASRCAMGTATITSREIDTIVGRIMIARITPALNSPIPKAGPEKTWMNPSRCTIAASTVSRRSGLRTNTPHRPTTTLGMAASSSIRNVNGMASHGGASSARKIAVNRLIGTAMRSARNDDSSVPATKGSAP